VFSAGTAEKELIHIRFVSHSPGFMVQIVEGRSHPTAYGDLITDRENYIARFTQNDVTDADIDFVRRTFGEVLPGRTTLVDEMTSTPLLDRVSVFDTDEMALRENWEGQTFTDARGVTHDFKTRVEQVLSERAVDHPDFRQVQVAPLQPPWPNYLEFRGTLEQLIQTLVFQGHDLRHVLAYEKEQGRPQVAAAIKAEIDRQNAEVQNAPQVPA
jgi:hypothetical protein